MNALISMVAGAAFSAAYVAPKPYCYFAAVIAANLVIYLRAR